MRSLTLTLSALVILVLSNCSTTSDWNSPTKTPSMSGPTVAAREAKIKSEPKGNYYIGRRYYVEETRFWGYVRRPRQPWSQAKLVLLNERVKKAPDRFPENGVGSQRYGFDTNYEYKLLGSFSGEKGYDPNSNQILPEFVLKGYSVLDKNPGWLFKPSDVYNFRRITLRP